MADAEATLARGETAPADFTLHDEMHGFRVAERIADLIGVSRLREFSTTELALLLASAYLHDIGMTPGRGHVQRHRGYLISGDAGQLTEVQRNKLQKWLDDHAEGATPPLATGIPDSATLARVDELLTYYCRSQHNDWSSAWIRENVATTDRELYFGFSDDLIQLCRSHHEGYDELIGPRFDAKLIGPDIVHPRYLAALLRIADILEFDPERTPPIIFRHREVAPSSTIYWHKDHEVSFRTEANYFIFYARPKDAATFQALQQMANEIDNELAICARLDKEGRFQLAPLRTGNDPRYVWRFEPILKRDLHAKANTFEEFEGAFQPNPRRLLSLLAGTQLYQTPMAAVRELLQNAFDAVREQIAYERLAEIERFGTADSDRISSRHFVTLDICADGDRWELVCTDSGVGMTREILRRRFLTSGSGRGHREFDLERRCLAHGFSVRRTGEFGIGALSYFMIADRLVLTTRRSGEPGDMDNAWQFRVSGLDDFGELRQAHATRQGTTVRLRMKPEIVRGDIEKLSTDLHQYLTFVLCNVPCRFVSRDSNGTTLMKIEPGWAKTAQDLASALFKTLEPRKRWKEPDNYVPPLPFPHREDAWSRLRWNVDEGDLPGGVGRFRIHLFWFSLDAGAARAWLDTRGNPLEVRGKALPANPTARYLSWNGIEIDDPEGVYRIRNYAIEADFESSAAGKVAVNRTSVDFSETAKKALQWTLYRVKKLESSWLELHISSPFWAHALRLSDGDSDVRIQSHWGFRSPGDEHYRIRPVRFPAIAGARRIRLNGVEPESLERYADFGETEWEDERVAPHRVVVQRDNRLDLVLVWDDDRNTEPLLAVPSCWRDVVIIESALSYYYSSTHAIVAAGRRELLDALKNLNFSASEALLREKDIPADVRLLLLFALWDGQRTWRNMTEIERTTLWDSATMRVQQQPSRFLVIDQGEREIMIYTREGVTVKAYDELTRQDLDDLLPDPGPSWQFERL